MQAPFRDELSALARHFASRGDAILQAWREAAQADPQQTTVGFLSRGQFNDHIPQLLDAFQRRLQAGTSAAETRLEEVKHGLQRWQQGYRLPELMHEWGHLSQVLFREIQDYAAGGGTMSREAYHEAGLALLALISEGVTESTAQYDRMRQAEAEGHLADLKLALDRFAAIDRRRTELIHQAVHDLRTNLQSVSTAADFFLNCTIPEKERSEMAQLVQKEMDSVGHMLAELMTLARLEAGQERRAVAAFDAAELVRDLASAARPQAAERGLFLRAEGPASLPVQGDSAKVRRILRNLVSNALKYTAVGGLTLSWGANEDTWSFTVQDTGPGFRAGPHSPIADDIREATDSARESDAANPGRGEEVLPSPSGGSVPASTSVHPSGEGIGLSIVKRLCELLEARLEMTSSATVGTVFRVVLPRRY